MLAFAHSLEVPSKQTESLNASFSLESTSFFLKKKIPILGSSS